MRKTNQSGNVSFVAVLLTVLVLTGIGVYHEIHAQVSGGGTWGPTQSLKWYESPSFGVTASAVTSTAATLINPLKYWTIQTSTAGSVTAYTMSLQGSLDGVTWNTIATATNAAPFSSNAGLAAPYNYFQVTSSAVTVAQPATIFARVLGIQ